VVAVLLGEGFGPEGQSLWVAQLMRHAPDPWGRGGLVAAWVSPAVSPAAPWPEV